MSALIEKPVKIELEVGRTEPIDIDEDYIPKKPQECDYETILKNGLGQFYPDMVINSNKKQNRIILEIKIPKQPDFKYEIALRLDEYLRQGPQIPIKSLKLLR